MTVKPFASRTMNSLMHGGNGMIRRIDRLVFSPRPDPGPSPLFIFGAPRSGTTLALQVLAHGMRTTALPRLVDYGYGATNLVFRLFRERLRRPPPIFQSRFGATPGLLSPTEAYGFWRKWFPDDVTGAHFHEPVLTDAAAEDLRMAIAEVQGHLHAPQLVKCLYLCFAITALANALPTARFLLMTRDAEAVAASLLKARRGIGPHSWWSVRPPGYQGWIDQSLIDQVIWQTAETRRCCMEQLAALPQERWRELRFEELCSSPSTSLDRIAEWLADCGHRRRDSHALPKHFDPPPPPGIEEVIALRSSRYHPWLMGSSE